MQILLGLCRYTKTPRPIFYHIGTPKSIGILLGSTSVVPASTILLTTTILKISRGNQLGRKAPPPPPLLRYMHQKQ